MGNQHSQTSLLTTVPSNTLIQTLSTIATQPVVASTQPVVVTMTQPVIVVTTTQPVVMTTIQSIVMTTSVVAEASSSSARSSTSARASTSLAASGESTSSASRPDGQTSPTAAAQAKEPPGSEGSQPGTGSAASALAAAQPTPPFVVIQQPKNGPFTPTVSFVGGIPSKTVDLPLSIVFLLLFAAGAATHISIFNSNKKRGHKFFLSDLVFDFCMVRVVTQIMRIAWVFKPKVNGIVLTAIIFQNAGTIVLFAVDNIFVQRILRAIHPNFGWHPKVNALFLALLVLVPFILVYNVALAVVSFFTLDRELLERIHDLQILGNVLIVFLAFLPIPALLATTVIPSSVPIEKFGAGRFRWKILVLIVASALLTVGAVVRLAGIVTVAPSFKPAFVHNKVLFFVTGFSLEIIVVVLYAVARIDLIFYVPDGSKRAGDYSRNNSPIPSDDSSVRNLIVNNDNGSSSSDLEKRSSNGGASTTRYYNDYPASPTQALTRTRTDVFRSEYRRIADNLPPPQQSPRTLQGNTRTELSAVDDPSIRGLSGFFKPRETLLDPPSIYPASAGGLRSPSTSVTANTMMTNGTSTMLPPTAYNPATGLNGLSKVAAVNNKSPFPQVPAMPSGDRSETTWGI